MTTDTDDTATGVKAEGRNELTPSPAWTGGPWVWDRNKPGEMRGLFGTNGETVLYADADVSNYGLSVDPFIEVSEANATLIAASPDLAEVLIEMFETGDVRIAFAGNPIACDRLEAKARAALAKARGQQ